MSGLKRTLGLPMLTFYGTGMILGAGIYSIIGKAAAHTGETLWIGFLLAAFAALLTAFSYAELSTMYPKAGAEYVYLKNAFESQPWLASTAGIAMAFSGAATAATVAIAFSGYLDGFVDLPNMAVAAGLLILFTGLACFGIQESGWANIAFTLIEIGGLGMVIFLGLNSERFGEALDAMPNWGTLSGAALIVFSYFGFENIVNLAEEAKKPKVHLPAAIFISVAVSTALYVLVALSVLALLSVEALSTSKAPLMAAVQTASEKAARVLGAIALFSTANTALISLVGASRIAYGMAKGGSLPQPVAAIWTRRKTPWVASLVLLAVALALLPLGKIETVAGISSLATMLAFLGINAVLISLRRNHPRKERPFRVPFAIGKIPVLPVCGALLSLIFLTQFDGTVYLAGGGFLIVAATVFYFTEKK